MKDDENSIFQAYPINQMAAALVCDWMELQKRCLVLTETTHNVQEIFNETYQRYLSGKPSEDITETHQRGPRRREIWLENQLQPRDPAVVIQTLDAVRAGMRTDRLLYVGFVKKDGRVQELLSRALCRINMHGAFVHIGE